MSQTLKKLAPAVVVLTGAMGLGGCATEKYVREQIAPVSQRVDALEVKLQETDPSEQVLLVEKVSA